MERWTEEEALKLASAQVSLIVYACTSGSLFNGLGHDIALSQRIGLLTGASALTTATAVLEALRTLGVSSVSVGTPYLPEVDEAEKRFLEQNGLEVVTIKGMGLKHNRKIGRIKPSDVFRLAMSFRSDPSQGIFLSCTNMPTLSVIERLERETGKPVVSSNRATLWAALKRLELPMEDIAGLKIPGLLESSTELAL
jgi:maleate isomerase